LTVSAGIERNLLPRWRTWALDQAEHADVRGLFADLRAGGTSANSIRKLRAALSVMFATAVETTC
jgi:hypothetical protein